MRRCLSHRASYPITRSRPTRSYAGPGLLAHVLVGKYCDHLPPHRQSRIYAREGIHLDVSTLANWVGQSSALCQALVEAIAHHVMATNKLHADDTPVPALAPGRGRTRTARLWTYVRDGRGSGDATPPTACFRYTPDRKGERPRAHLKDFSGTLIIHYTFTSRTSNRPYKLDPENADTYSSMRKGSVFRFDQ